MKKIERECSPQESLRIAIKEMNEMRKVIIPKQSVKDMLKDIEEDK